MDGDLTLAAISFPDEYRASEFLTAMNGLTARGHLLVADAVFVTKDRDGKTDVTETTDLETAGTALGAGLWGGLLGLLLGGPVGMLVAGGLGAGVGAVTAKAVDLGIKDDFIKEIRTGVAPGTTTLALLLSHIDEQPLREELARFPKARWVAGDVPGRVFDSVREELGSQDAPAS